MSWDMTAVVEHRIEIAGHATRALEVDGGGPGIVLLHGWGDSADTWRPLLGQLGVRCRAGVLRPTLGALSGASGGRGAGGGSPPPCGASAGPPACTTARCSPS